MMQSLAFLSKDILADPSFTLPKMTSMGDEVKTVTELASVMGIDSKVAAAYVINSDASDELKADAIKTLQTTSESAFAEGIGPVIEYAHKIARKDFIESKRIRMVRNASGSKYFGQPVGSIIVGDGQQPLDAIAAAPNDVPGYEKVVDRQGNPYYIGREGNRWVVRSGVTKGVLYESDSEHGEIESLTWLNTKLGGAKGEAQKKKSMPNDLEVKKQYTTLAIQSLGKRGHAFRNKNGDYSYPVSTVADLKNAIQAFGRAAPEDRERLKAFIKKRARQLKREDLIPDNWKTGEPVDLESKIKHDRSSLDRSPGKNWVELSGQLPGYIREIAHALIRDHGFTVDRAIATAVNRVKKWAAGVGNVNADTRAKAAAAVAEWEKLKAKNKARVLANRAKKG
jgi:hypothetical protein